MFEELQQHQNNTSKKEKSNNEWGDLEPTTEAGKEKKDFLKTVEAEGIVEKKQQELNLFNEKLAKGLDKNISYTRDNISLQINIGYSSTSKIRPNIVFNNYNGAKYGDVSINKNSLDNSTTPDRAITNGIRINYNGDGTNVGSYEKNSGTEWFGYNGDIDWQTDNIEYFSNFAKRKEEYRSENPFFNEQVNFLDAIMEQGQYEGTPLDYLKDKYVNSSEQDKIELAIFMAKYMNDEGYDYEFAEKSRMGDVSSADMWLSYKNGGVAGVCRHHHSEVSKFLKSVGFETGLVTTNSGAAHAITWGKKEDGSVFLVDYGTYYEGKDFKELMAIYQLNKGALRLKQNISDESGKPIGTFQTDLEKIFEETTSSIGTGDTLKYSKKLSKNGVSIVNGHDVILDLDSESSKSINYTYGDGSKRIGVNYNLINNIDYSDYESLGVSGGIKFGSREGSLGEFWLGGKFSENNFTWENGKKRSFKNIGLDTQYSKELYSDGVTSVGFGAVAQLQAVSDVQNAKKDGDLGIEDNTGNLGFSLNMDKKLSKKVEGSMLLSYGGDIWSDNLRSGESIKLYEKKSVNLGIKYKGNNSNIIGGIGYEQGLGYEKTNGNISVKSGDLTTNIVYEYINNSKNPLLLNEATTSIEIVYHINDAWKISSGIKNNSNGVTSNTKTSLGIQANF